MERDVRFYRKLRCKNINTYKLHNDARVFVLKMDNKSVTSTRKRKPEEEEEKDDATTTLKMPALAPIETKKHTQRIEQHPASI